MGLLIRGIIGVCMMMLFYSCGQQPVFIRYDFDSVNDRIWIGEDFWVLPLEEWRVNKGRIEFKGEGQQYLNTLLPGCRS